MNTVLFVNATIGFSENLFLVCCESINGIDITTSQGKTKTKSAL